MRLYWNNWRIQPKTSNEALNCMMRQAGRVAVQSLSGCERRRGAIVPANCDPAVRLNRLRATATASLHDEAWQGKGPALLTICRAAGNVSRTRERIFLCPQGSERSKSILLSFCTSASSACESLFLHRHQFGIGGNVEQLLAIESETSLMNPRGSAVTKTVLAPVSSWSASALVWIS